MLLKTRKIFGFVAVLAFASASIAAAGEFLTPDDPISPHATNALPEPGYGHGFSGHGPLGPERGPGWDREVTCYARNWRGETFAATGWNARLAQNEALRACFSHGGNCRASGCM